MVLVRGSSILSKTAACQAVVVLAAIWAERASARTSRLAVEPLLVGDSAIAAAADPPIFPSPTAEGHLRNVRRGGPGRKTTTTPTATAANSPPVARTESTSAGHFSGTYNFTRADSAGEGAHVLGRWGGEGEVGFTTAGDTLFVLGEMREPKAAGAAAPTAAVVPLAEEAEGHDGDEKILWRQRWRRRSLRGREKEQVRVYHVEQSSGGTRTEETAEAQAGPVLPAVITPGKAVGARSNDVMLAASPGKELETAAGRAGTPSLRGTARILEIDDRNPAGDVVDRGRRAKHFEEISAASFLHASEREEKPGFPPTAGIAGRVVGSLWPQRNAAAASSTGEKLDEGRASSEQRRLGSMRGQRWLQQAKHPSDDEHEQDDDEGSTVDSFGSVGLMAFLVCFGLLFCVMEVAKCYCLLECRRRQRLRRRRERNAPGVELSGQLPIAVSRPVAPSVPAAGSKEGWVEVIVDGVSMSAEMPGVGGKAFPSARGYPVADASHALQEAAEHAERFSPRMGPRVATMFPAPSGLQPARRSSSTPNLASLLVSPARRASLVAASPARATGRL